MDGIRRRLSYANIAATLALILATSGGAIAATGGFASGGKLQACVSEEGAIRLLRSGKHCRHGEKTIAWSEAGPTGPAGVPGAPGTPGAAGAKGEEGRKGADGESPNVKWAAISKEGEITASHGGVVAAAESGEHYVVAFNQDITNCAILATPNGPSNVKAAIISAVRAGTEVQVYSAFAGGGSGLALNGFSIVAYC